MVNFFQPKAKLIQGMKQSRGDIHALADMIRAVGHKIPIFSALDDMLFPSFVIGARGAAAAMCTVVPELCVQLYLQRLEISPANSPFF